MLSLGVFDRYEIDVRILNHPNWTSTAQVMVFSQDCLSTDFRTVQTENSGLSRAILAE